MQKLRETRPGKLSSLRGRDARTSSSHPRTGGGTWQPILTQRREVEVGGQSTERRGRYLAFAQARNLNLSERNPARASRMISLASTIWAVITYYCASRTDQTRHEIQSPAQVSHSDIQCSVDTHDWSARWRSSRMRASIRTSDSVQKTLMRSD